MSSSKYDLDKIVEYLKIAKDVRIPYYDLTKKHFKVGDKAYTYPTLDNPFEPLEVKIVDIEDFRKDYGESGAVYYWITYNCLTKLERIWEYTKLYFWNYVLSYLGIRQPKVSWKLGPGHAVSAGDEIFKTKYEALVSLNLWNAIFNIEEIKELE